MASVNNITSAMNEITLEDEENGGLSVDYSDDNEQVTQSVFNPKLCLIGRFISEGQIDFQAMKQTLAALWRPGNGVFIKEIDMNLYMFQFYYDIDIKRVISGSPWSFNRKTLIINHIKDRENPRCVRLNSIDL